jgi:hypothetical protein
MSAVNMDLEELVLCAVATLFAGVRERGTISPRDRHRIRSTTRAAIAAGATEGDLVEAVRRLSGEVQGSPALVEASYVVLADCLAAAGSRRLTRVHRLLRGGPAAADALPDTCEVVVFWIQERDQALVTGVLAALDACAGACEDHAVLVVASTADARRLIDDIGHLVGTPLCAATARCGRETLVDGYREAAKVLDLALAAEREPGLYRIDDFLIEYAAMCDPVVSARLMNIVRPLLTCDRLFETLKAFVRCGHNRARTARELFVHRTTVDYRIRRIEEITGYDPAGGRGSQVLAAAVTLFSLRRTL